MRNPSITNLAPDEPTERTWNGRDDNHQHFFGKIPQEQRQITLALNWKASANDEPRLVGRYRINLAELKAQGYVRMAERGYILRFQRRGGNIEIAINRKEKPLLVGQWP